VPQKPPGSRVFARVSEGRTGIARRRDACVFYEPRASGSCAIHRQLGERYLPSSCRHFPRVALLDPRGVSITLSHYCPTAARMLFRTDIRLEIVEDPPGFPPDFPYEGLDARDVLPPLLRPGLLWDLAGYSRWEHEAVALLARDAVAPEGALDCLHRAAVEIERWSPQRTALAEHVSAAFRTAAPGAAATSRWGLDAPVVNRYLAARLFASWVPYRSGRLVDLVKDLMTTHERLTAAARRKELLEAIREVDLLVVHGREPSGTPAALRAAKA
jgi:hypothetical protein